MAKRTSLGAKILVADDDPTFLGMIGYTLHAACYEVVVILVGVDAFS
jgi:DNA-binding response OmpR family regulator